MPHHITPISRRTFLRTTAMAAAAPLAAADTGPPAKPLRPRCLTMWDFSWIERRWPGAGYEDWPLILDELRERGYDAIRLDAFPQPLMTTECWGVVDFKDWPLLNWDWVKDLCRVGVETAAATGQWVAIASSNFCGPQFKGMWRDVEWHHSVTKLIKSSPILPELRETKLARRL